MYKVEVNGVRLAIEEQGTGQAIIFVPGGLSDYRSWLPQVELFSQQYQAITYSRRYQYPEKPVPGADSSVAANAADLAALIDRLGVSPVHIVGHSYGAFTALVCAREHPELVKTLVLGEPPALPLLVKDPNNPTTILPLLFKDPRAAMALIKFGVKAIKPAQAAFAAGRVDAAVQAFVRGITGRPVVVEELPPMIGEQLRANGQALQAELDVSEPLTCEAARRISVPTLLVRGDQSPAFLTAIINQLSHCMPNIDQLVLHGASHFLHWEKPDEFNAGLEAFLAKHRASSRPGQPPNSRGRDLTRSGGRQGSP